MLLVSFSRFSLGGFSGRVGAKKDDSLAWGIGLNMLETGFVHFSFYIWVQVDWTGKIRPNNNNQLG